MCKSEIFAKIIALVSKGTEVVFIIYYLKCF